MNNNNFPKTIWFLWLQGIENAPLVVNKCYESWVKNNPGWSIVLLDENTLKDYITIKPRQLANQALSDIIRINLLAKYGGIWVDATSFCNKPLDNWIHAYMKQGFFAFERPSVDRMISSWFIACYKNSYIIETYQKAVNSYWDKNPNLKAFETSRWRSRFRKLQQKDPQLWFGFFATKILRVYPYFWFHYIFESLYIKDKEFRQQWAMSPKMSADIPHNLQFAGLFNPIKEKIKDEIDTKVAPLYKLTWKYEEASYKPGTILEYLLST